MTGPRRPSLPALLLAALVGSFLALLPATPAAAGDMGVSVARSGFQLGTVTDDLGQISCGSDCAGSYNDNCYRDPELGVWLCDGVEVTLTTTVPGGFDVSWSGCESVSAGGVGCTVSNYTPTPGSRPVTATYTDVAPPAVTGVGTTPLQHVRDSLQVAAGATDNDQVAQVEFELSKGGAGPSHLDPTAPYAATFDTSGLPDGEYVLTATATDRSGITSPPVTRSVVVDHTVPDLDLSGPGVGFSAEAPEFRSSSSASWSFLASDAGGSGVASVSCVLDGQPQACEPSDVELTADLADGPHSGHFEVTDNAGNVFTGETWHLFVDSIAPEATITSGPRRPVALSRTATFDVSAEDATDLLLGCSLDSDEYLPCDDPPTYAGLAAGSHRFRFTAVDQAGSEDASPATWTWTVPHDDRTLATSSRWKAVEASRYYLGTARTARARGASLSMPDVRARELYLVASTVPGGGTIEVRHGSRVLDRVRLASARARHQRVIEVASYDALSPARQLRIVVVSARKPVTIDGVAVVSR